MKNGRELFNGFIPAADLIRCSFAEIFRHQKERREQIRFLFGYQSGCDVVLFRWMWLYPTGHQCDAMFVNEVMRKLVRQCKSPAAAARCISAVEIAVHVEFPCFVFEHAVKTVLVVSKGVRYPLIRKHAQWVGWGFAEVLSKYL